MKTLIIDGNNLAMRTWHSNKDMCNANGEGTGIMFGVYRNIVKLLKNLKDVSRLIVCWDGGRDFRNKLYNDNKYQFTDLDKYCAIGKNYTEKIGLGYKGTRQKQDGMEDAYKQIDVTIEFLEAMGIANVKIKGLEADDLMYYFARRYSPAIMSSGDSDFLQCASNSITIAMQASPSLRKKLKGTEYEDRELLFTKENFASMHELITRVKDEKKALPLPKESFLYYKACIGDTSDNIPGISGVGEGTLNKELKKYHCNFLQMLEDPKSKLGKKIQKQMKLFKFSLSAMSLPYAYKQLKEGIEKELPDTIDTKLPHDIKKVKEMAIKYELNTFLQKFDENVDMFYKVR